MFAFPSKGALLGLLSGLAVSFWVGVGAQIYPPSRTLTRPLPLTTEGCNFTIGTGQNWSTSTQPTQTSTFVTMLHHNTDYKWAFKIMHHSIVKISQFFLFTSSSSTLSYNICLWTCPELNRILYWINKERAKVTSARPGPNKSIFNWRLSQKFTVFKLFVTFY